MDLGVGPKPECAPRVAPCDAGDLIPPMAAPDHPCANHQTPMVPSGAERRTWWAVALTLAMMFAELAVGTWSHSLALTAAGRR